LPGGPGSLTGVAQEQIGVISNIVFGIVCDILEVFPWVR
jgi:hypothetical protein